VKRHLLAAALAGLANAAATACGACVEDKVAATYDHRVVERAAVSGDVMVFCEMTGSSEPRQLKAAVRRVRGIRVWSLRVSVQAAALSFAMDPALQSPQATVDALQRGAAPGTRLTIVHMQARPAGPKPVGVKPGGAVAPPLAAWR
jgi:hypothetical protein